MKYLSLLSLGILCFAGASAQTLTPRTDDTTTPLDERLVVGKTLSIPSGVTPGFNGGLVRVGSVFYSTTDNLVYVYKGSDGWKPVTAYTYGAGLTLSANTITNNLSTGIAGGQTLTGGTGAGNNLTISTTSHSTKGKVIIGNMVFDEANNRIGINTFNPTQALSISGNAWITGVIYAGGIFNPNVGEYGKLQMLDGGARIVRSVADNGAAFEIWQESTGSTGNIFQWRNNSGLQGVINKDGRLGLGILSPTAQLHLRAGSTAANSAPIKFSPGTNLASPESNALEWDGTRLYQTSNSGTRNTLAYLSDIGSGGGGTAYAFGTGLTVSGSNVTNNLSTGVAGGQTIIGGTAAGNQLILKSTSNASQGKIIIGSVVVDEVNNRLGVNVPNPTQALSVSGDAWISGAIFAGGISNPNFGEYGKLQMLDGGARILRSVSDNGAAFEVWQDGVGSTGNIFQWRNNTALQGVISRDGKLGLGVLNPTAQIHLKGGTSGAAGAPVKFTPGPNLNTPENNALEYDGERLYQTNNSGTRNPIAYLSDITSTSSGYLPLAGGTLTGAVNGTSATFNAGSSQALSIRGGDGGAGNILRVADYGNNEKFSIAGSGTATFGSNVIVPSISIGANPVTSGTLGLTSANYRGEPWAVGNSGSSISTGVYDMLRFGWDNGSSHNSAKRTAIATNVTVAGADFGLSFFTSSGAAAPTEKLNIAASGQIKINTVPVTSASGSFDFLTRNSATGMVEKLSGINISNSVDKTTDQAISGIKSFNSPINLNTGVSTQLTRSGQPLLNSANGGVSLGLNAGSSLGNGTVYIGDYAGSGAGGWGGNIGIGLNALSNNLQGHNVAIGPGTLANNNNYNSIAMGVNAASNTTGSHLIAIGPGALSGNLGNNNIGIGRGTLANASSGGANVSIGTFAASGVVGNNNVVIGEGAGANLGNQNIIIGAGVSLPSANNQINIGNVIYGSGTAWGGAPSATAKVGIGIISPSANLDVAGTVKASGVVTFSNLAGMGPRMVVADAAGILSTQAIPTGDAAGGTGYVSLTANENIGGVKTFSNNVGIGTADPGIYQLAVKGTIRAQAVKVDPSGWSDFVFDKAYDLPALVDVEKHIKEKHHLPGIPSESDVKKNGIEIGDMSSLLLKKVEELTLYLIKQDKEIAALKEELRQVKSKKK